MCSVPHIAFLTRKETFSACHRLHSQHLTDAENKEVFGKCNHINGHGHNYIVELTVRGPIDSRTGMVMNITDLKEAMNKVIFDNLDHKNLDKDVDYFKDKPSTTENVAVYIWENIDRILQKPTLLYEVKIYETDKNSVIFRGPVMHSCSMHRNQNGSAVCAKGISKNCTNISSDSD